MAQLMGGGFNASLVKPEQSSGSLPLGKHPVTIVESDVKPTKGGDGFFVELKVEIFDGECKGQSGHMRFNIYNNSDKARQIAEAQLSAVCHVVGLLTPFEDTQALHNIPFIIEVGNQKLSPEQEAEKAQGKSVTPYTEVKRVYDINGNEPGKSGGGQQQQSAPQQQQQQQAAPQQQWGNQQQQQQAPAQQQQAQQQWGNQQQQQQAAPQQQQAGNGQQWGNGNQQQQQQKPAWGQK